MTEYSSAYSEGAFKTKLASLDGLRQLIESAKRLHTLMRDPATPLWIKALCIGALGYLILPTDAVADLIPVLGHGDDLVMLTAALSAIAARWPADPPAINVQD